MRKLHGGLIAAAAMAVIGGIAGTGAQNATPYKLGMFDQNGRQFVGLVIQDAQVVDLSRANIGAPATLKQLIAASDARMTAQLAALAAKPGTTIPVAQLKTLPPIPDPTVLLNAAVNYSEHGIEMTGQATVAASADKVDPKVAMGIPSVLDPQAGRPAAEPVLLPEGRKLDQRARRPDRAAERPHANRLGMRAEHRDRQDREVRQGGERRRVHLRLHPRQRRLGSRRPRRWTSRIGLGPGQEPRHVFSNRPLRRAPAVRARIRRNCRSSSR